jgi:homoserine kinase type II
MQPDTVVEIEQILSNYDIGDLVDFQPDQRGYCNTSFTLETRLNDNLKKYFLRRYKKSIREEEIRFEHSVISRVVEKGLDIIAELIPTREGRTYLWKSACVNDPFPYYYALFEFLSGEDKYTWVNPRCTSREIESSAEVLARFHQAVVGWTPDGQRAEKKILDLLPLIKPNLDRCIAKDAGNAFDRYLRGNLELIYAEIKRCQATLGELHAGEFIQLVIHCDFHPGNMKFSQNRVVGLFDFDWSKIDLRLFDIALSVFYFFSSWGSPDDGMLRLEDTAHYLNTYQHAVIQTNPALRLSFKERQGLPAMLAASNLYVLNWTLLDYLNKEVDPAEYLKYLKHGVNCIHWLKNRGNQLELERMLARSIPDE